jgi:hypothetical protein
MSTSSPAPASLNSVVVIPEEDFKGWRKLNSSEPLARLHAKFWGRGMPEENEWRDDDPTGSEVCVDDEDDIRPGCRVLDIDNEAIVELKEIWVRVSVFTIGGSSVSVSESVFTNFVGRISPNLQLHFEFLQ